MSTVPSAFSPDFGKGGLQNGTSHLNGNGLGRNFKLEILIL